MHIPLWPPSFNWKSSLINCSANSASSHHITEGLACFSGTDCTCSLPLHFALQSQMKSIKELSEKIRGFYEIFKSSFNSNMLKYRPMCYRQQNKKSSTSYLLLFLFFSPAILGFILNSLSKLSNLWAFHSTLGRLKWN